MSIPETFPSRTIVGTSTIARLYSKADLHLPPKTAGHVEKSSVGPIARRGIVQYHAWSTLFT